jgi:putative FmdB family regulatory protein
MPNYDYHCKECGHEFTEMVCIDDRDRPTLDECPSCHKVGAVLRGITAVQLSYSGFKDMYHRAGNGWKEMQQKIKSGSGRKNSIRTK